MTSAIVRFCGEEHEVAEDRQFTIGREGDLAVDENPFLHRRLLTLSRRDGLWWLENVGTRIAARLTDGVGGVEATVRPGAGLPLVFPVNRVVFTAGSTTYELDVEVAAAPFARVLPFVGPDESGDTTIGVPSLTLSQRRLLLALSEPLLRHDGVGTSAVPDSAAVARRLGWTTTRYNRKLDNVCDKFDRLGVTGLRGGAGRMATNRRARLVEHVIGSRIVTSAELGLLDQPETGGED